MSVIERSSQFESLVCSERSESMFVILLILSFEAINKMATIECEQVQYSQILQYVTNQT